MKKMFTILVLVLTMVGCFGLVFSMTNNFENSKPTSTEINFENLSYIAFGDSITYGYDFTDGGRLDTPYPKKVGEILNLKAVSNMGENSATFVANEPTTPNKTADILSYKGTADIISVLLGVNDFGYNLPLGNINSKDNTTIYGSLHLIAEKLSTKQFENSYIFFMTPMPWESPFVVNSQGYTLVDVCSAIKHTANKYGFDVLDLYNTSGFEEEISSGIGDKLHPSQNFVNEKLAPKIAKFIKDNIN